VKESDRTASMAGGLRVLGLEIEESTDGATIVPARMSSGTIDSRGDHRIAMSFAIAAQRADGDVRIGDIANVGTSFPGFDALSRQVGMQVDADSATVASSRSPDAG